MTQATADDHQLRSRGLNQTMNRLREELINVPDQSEKEFVISRVFDAPRDLVWKALTESDRLMHWWGPKGFTMRAANVDLRPGGVFHYGMQAPNGSEMWGKWVYREIVPPEKLVFVNSFSDQAGNTIRAPFSATWPLEILNTVTFEEHSGRTSITIRGGPINATEEERKTFQGARGSMEQGFTGTFDQLEAYLAKA
jgi:uncharacterized protein YndB with AHSA1/START domain